MNNISLNWSLSTEMARMEAVKRYDILDTPPDGSFDHITAIAARRFGTPIAIVSIVDENRIWFKSHHGLPIEQIGRDEGLCATTIMSSYPRVLTDAKNDSCALANPLVAGDFGLRFYAGAPLRTHDGYNLGTLCVIDQVTREVTQEQIDDLTDLAGVVMDQLELRISARRAVAREKLLAKEIDHRVMNSLQFISSMLSIQSMAPDAAAAAGELRRAANRVAAVAQVHRNFYASEASEVSCVRFLRRLCKDLSEILGQPVEVAGDGDMVPTTMIQSIGLITSELVTNAAKHGEGGIAVSYRVRNGERILTVSNEGKPLPEDFNPAKTRGLGMRLVTTMATQLNAVFSTDRLSTGTGACFTVAFQV